MMKLVDSLKSLLSVIVGYKEIVAIVIGSLIGLVVILTCALFCCRRRKAIHHHAPGLSVPLGNMHSAIAASGAQQFYPGQAPAFIGQIAGAQAVYPQIYPKPGELVAAGGMPQPVFVRVC
jgi:hypothetical protein